MISMMEYKGYFGNVCYSKEDKLLHGEVLGIKSYIGYIGHNLTELEKDFHDAIDDYLNLTEREGMTPEKPVFELRKPA